MSLILIDIQAERDVFEVQRRGQGGARRPRTKDNTSHAEKTIRCVTSPFPSRPPYTFSNPFPFLLLLFFQRAWMVMYNNKHECVTNRKLFLFFFSSFFALFLLLNKMCNREILVREEQHHDSIIVVILN